MNGKDWKERLIESARDCGIEADNPIWKRLYQAVLDESRRLEEIRCAAANLAIDALTSPQAQQEGEALLR